MNDVLIGSIRNYGWAEISPFVISVDRSGYGGEKVMFTENVTLDARDRLRAHGWRVLHVTVDATQDYGTARHIPVRDFLRKHVYRYVLYCDVRDLVFQVDPVPWLVAHLAPAELIGASECLPIRHEPTNQGWILRTLGQDTLTWLMDEPILCAGTIVGTHWAVVGLLTAICELSCSVSGWGYDQAYVNYLLRTPAFRDITRIPRMSDGFIATCSWFLSGPERFTGLYTDEAPVFATASATVRTPRTLQPFAIVHQYDRGGGWDRRMRERYA